MSRYVKKRVNRRGKILTIICAVLVALTAWTTWENLTVDATRIEVTSAHLPAGFDGYTIAQVSDFHNTTVATHHSMLLDLLRQARPDIIAFTGDLVDSNRTNIAVAVDFVSRACRIAPCYYVTGNHEARLGAQYTDLERQLRGLGVHVLRNEHVTLTRADHAIDVLGIDDPDMSGRTGASASDIVASEIAEAKATARYSVLLSHRPEHLRTYADAGVNLVFAGHAHGGQIRLPFIGGLVAPDQGFFPRFDAGTYTKKNTTMVVSRGIGNSIFPVRFNNRPELVVVTLRQRG
ncbi:metallophosphoesterase [Schaalia suimastitidis]|uniref:metallophosphoesterase n=1 Tax=Schaalia suimastitidis TaxID=121163 RepID=UPI00041725B4|nr:metallophosphoesterase [Schaalia suimastitidis]